MKHVYNFKNTPETRIFFLKVIMPAKSKIQEERSKIYISPWVFGDVILLKLPFK